MKEKLFFSRRHFLALGSAVVAATRRASAAEAPVMPARGFCAHRGAMSTHPENTLPAFAEALRLGARMIEFDVQLSRDGALVLMHDDTIDRTTDRQGRVADLTLSELREADAGVRKEARFAGTRIPTFEDALAMMPREVWLNCHLKGGSELGAAVAKVIANSGRLHQAFVAAENEAAQAARGVVPEILVCNMERQSSASDNVSQTIAMKADFIQLLGKGEVGPELVEELHAAGIRVNYYSCASPEIARKLLAAGVNFPLVDDLAAFFPLARELGI
jgi:glycerophosphoryl diester phosphodiesterase